MQGDQNILAHSLFECESTTVIISPDLESSPSKSTVIIEYEWLHAGLCWNIESQGFLWLLVITCFFFWNHVCWNKNCVSIFKKHICMHSLVFEFRDQIMLQWLLVQLGHIPLEMLLVWFYLEMQMSWWPEEQKPALMPYPLQVFAGIFLKWEGQHIVGSKDLNLWRKFLCNK